MPRWVLGAMLALIVATCGLATPQAALAAPGGPVILGGDDLTDHGFRNTTTNMNEDGWLYLEKAIENVLPVVTRTGNDGSIAALGSADSTTTFGGNAGAAMHWAAQDAGSGVSVTYYNGGPAINGFFSALTAGTTNPAIIWIAGDNSSNDLADSGGVEAAALTNNATAIGDFVNSGGGLISHGTEYGWLSALLPGATVVLGGFSGDLYLTPAGQSAFPGLTNADINAGPWHNHFEGNLGGLQVLAASNVINDNTGADAPVILGGAAVTLPGSITLDPATDTNPAGTQHTVTATVRNNQGQLQEGVTVNFQIISGPNTGDSGSDTTDVNGQATFTWTGDGGAGTDTVQASFVDGTGNTRSTTATKTWEQVNQPPDCSSLKINGPSMWPPNHKMRSFTVSGGTDPDLDPLTISITSVFQDEPVNGTGDGDTSPDAVITSANTVDLRGERSGKLNGRVYYVGVTLSDNMGGSCSSTLTVGVPHDQGPKGGPVGDGPLYDSTQP